MDGTGLVAVGGDVIPGQPLGGGVGALKPYLTGRRVNFFASS